MAEKQIRTRLQMLAGTTAEWAQASQDGKKLLANEFAIEWESRDAEGHYSGFIGVKIGTGDKTFNELEYFGDGSGNVVANIEVNSTDDHVEKIIAAVGDMRLEVGDIAIVRAKAGDDANISTHARRLCTAYVYEGSEAIPDTDPVQYRQIWNAMEGNVSAANVLIPNKITLAGNYGKDSRGDTLTYIGNKKIGDSFEAGTSLNEILMDILSKRLQPADPTLPTATIAVSGSDGASEAGRTYTKPTATLTTKTGSYTYDGVATGVKFETGKVTIAYGADPDATGAVKNTNTTVFGNGSTIQMKPAAYAANDTTAIFTDSIVSYTFSGKAGHTQGNIAKDNLGGDSNPVKRIAANANLTVKDASASFRGYRKTFCGTTNESVLTSEVIRGFNLLTEKINNVTENGAKASTTQFKVTVPTGSTNLIIACPTSSVGKAYKLSNVLMNSAGVWDDYTSKFVEQADVAVADYRGQYEEEGEVKLNGAQDYNVYMYKFGALTGDTEFKITLA